MKSFPAETLYNITASLVLPLMRLRGLFNEPWRETLDSRLVRGDWESLLQEEKMSHLWVHAASVGEVGGVSPVVIKLQEYLAAANTSLLLTTTTTTGAAEAARKGLKVRRCLLGFDHPALVRRMIEYSNPRLFIAAETELWPALVFGLKRNKVPLVLVNGRVSEYSYPGYRLIKPLIGKVLCCFDLILVQTELDKRRFVSLGAKPGSVLVAGSTKYDFEAEQLSMDSKKELCAELGLNPEEQVLVAGSVRPEELEAVVEAYLRVKENHSGLQLIAAPRHPEKFQHAEQLLKEKGIKFNQRSKGAAEQPASVLLLDTMGELRRMYSLASIAFVGGTLVNIGGHNPLEAAAYGVPVIVGPHVGNVKDAISQLESKDGLLMVSSAQELVGMLLKLLDNPLISKRYGELGRSVAEDNAGATERVMNALKPFLDGISDKSAVSKAAEGAGS